jgi:hypothetical protein
MLALVFVQRYAETGNPGVGFEASSLFPGAEAKFRWKAAASEQKLKDHRALETVGPQKKMMCAGGGETRDMQSLRQRGLW